MYFDREKKAHLFVGRIDRDWGYILGKKIAVNIKKIELKCRKWECISTFLNFDRVEEIYRSK